MAKEFFFSMIWQINLKYYVLCQTRTSMQTWPPLTISSLIKFNTLKTIIDYPFILESKLDKQEISNHNPLNRILSRYHDERCTMIQLILSEKKLYSFAK